MVTVAKVVAREIIVMTGCLMTVVKVTGTIATTFTVTIMTNVCIATVAMVNGTVATT